MFRAILISLLFTFALFAEEERFSMDKLHEEVRDPMAYSEEKVADAEQEISPVFVVFRIIGSLALVSVLLVGFVWGIRKSGMVAKVPVNSDSSLELLEELQTGQGNSLLMVRFNEKVILLGQTGSSFSAIDSVEGEVAEELIAKSAGGRSVGTFRANLNKYVNSLQKGSGRA